MDGGLAHTIERINAAVTYVESHLDSPLLIAEIARAACYSPWHFHRTFSAIVGETVMEYVRRRRLTGAAESLRTGNRSIIEVAMDAGFDSQEAFTRAFRRHFGTTPGRFRRDAPDVRTAYRSPLTAEIMRRHIEKRLGGLTMEPTFVDLEEFTVVGLSGRFTQETTAGIPALWDRFTRAWTESGRDFPVLSYGVCFDETEGDCANASFVYMAAFGLEGDAPAGLETRHVPANRYAVFTHVGEVFSIKETYQHIFGTWLPASGMQRAEGPDFELYDERFDPETMGGEVDIYLPVRPA